MLFSTVKYSAVHTAQYSAVTTVSFDATGTAVQRTTVQRIPGTVAPGKGRRGGGLWQGLGSIGRCSGCSDDVCSALRICLRFPLTLFLVP
jgi:hypothetical protein